MSDESLSLEGDFPSEGVGATLAAKLGGLDLNDAQRAILGAVFARAARAAGDEVEGFRFSTSFEHTLAQLVITFTPPENPVTPPGVPVPYPNTGTAEDTKKSRR